MSGPSSTRAAEPSQEKAISGALRRGTPEKRTNMPCPATPVVSTPSPKRAQQTPPTPAKVTQPRPASPCVPVASAPSASAEAPAGPGVGLDPKPKKPPVEARLGRAPLARAPRGPEPDSNHSAEQCSLAPTTYSWAGGVIKHVLFARVRNRESRTYEFVQFNQCLAKSRAREHLLPT